MRGCTLLSIGVHRVSGPGPVRGLHKGTIGRLFLNFLHFQQKKRKMICNTVLQIELLAQSADLFIFQTPSGCGEPFRDLCLAIAFLFLFKLGGPASISPGKWNFDFCCVFFGTRVLTKSERHQKSYKHVCDFFHTCFFIRLRIFVESYEQYFLFFYFLRCLQLR